MVGHPDIARLHNEVETSLDTHPLHTSGTSTHTHITLHKKNKENLAAAVEGEARGERMAAAALACATRRSGWGGGRGRRAGGPRRGRVALVDPGRIGTDPDPTVPDSDRAEGRRPASRREPAGHPGRVAGDRRRESDRPPRPRATPRIARRDGVPHELDRGAFHDGRRGATRRGVPVPGRAGGGDDRARRVVRGRRGAVGRSGAPRPGADRRAGRLDVAPAVD